MLPLGGVRNKAFKERKRLLFAASLVLSACLGFGADNRGTWSLGLHNPGLGVRYNFKAPYALESRIGYADRTTVAGMRLYRLIKDVGPAHFGLGGEMDYVTSSQDGVDSQGYAAQLFVYSEYFATSLFSLGLDFGPAYASLTRNRNGQSLERQNRSGFIMNLSVNWYIKGLHR